MNKIYRLIWSKKSNSLVAVSEAAKSKRQGSSPSKSQLVGAVAAALLSLSSVIDKAHALTNTLPRAGQIELTTEASFTNLGNIYTGNIAGILNSNTQNLNEPTDIWNQGGIFTDSYGIHIQGNPSEATSNAVFYPGRAGYIFNSGQIETSLNAIHLEAGNVGSIQNLGSGVILSTLASGINIQRGFLAGTTEGNVWVASQDSTVASIVNYGIISAANAGIQIGDATVTGSIQNIGNFMYAGTFLGGIIDAGNVGINLDGTTLNSGAGVSNSGVISSYVLGGITLNNSSIISGNILNSGSILGNFSGIGLTSSGISGSISNSGLIEAATEDFATVSGSALSVDSSLITGDIINYSAGEIVALENNSHGVSLFASQVYGRIINAGTIFAFLNNGIDIDSALLGGISNTGIIGSYGGDPTLISAEGRVVHGAFTGSGQGIHIDSSAISGNIINSGNNALIQALNTGFAMNLSSVTGSINNSGTIQGLRYDGMTLSGSRITGFIDNSGSILGGEYGLAGENLTIAQDISNSGLIRGGSQDGIYLENSTITGGIVNSGSILGFNTSGIIGYDNGIRAINTKITQSVSNTGLIRGILDSGIYFASGSSVSGSINNFGTISGGGNGIVAIDSSVTGGVSNSGLIQGTTGSGIALLSTYQDMSLGNITNNSLGVIEGREVGIGAASIFDNSGTFFGVTVGDITNRGRINALGTNTSAAIYIEGATVGHILNDTGGTLSADDFGIRAMGSYQIGLGNSHTSSIASITNNGLISVSNSDSYIYLPVGISIEAAGNLTSNVIIAGSVINSGSISMTNASMAYGIYNSYSDIGGDIKNSGTNSLISISGNGYGILSAGATVHGSIINEGSIILNSSLYGAGIYNTGSIAGGISNTGRIDGGIYGIKVQSYAPDNTIANIFNSGYVSGHLSALSINSYGGYYSQSIGLIENQTGGTLSGGTNGIFIGDPYISAAGSSYTSLGVTYYQTPVAEVGNIINRGTISAQSLYGYAIHNAGTIGGITNTGLIIGGATGTGIINQGSIGTLLNTGRITASSGPHVDIYNEAGVNARGQTIGVIDRLINAQGGSSNALSFAGRLPTAYEIFVTSTSSYGQFAVTSSSGTMLFDGIYNTSSLTGNHTYENVITGVGSSYLTGSLSGTFNNRYPWVLMQDGASSGNWDLVTSAPSGPGAMETQSSLRQVAQALKSPFIVKNIALNNALNYDCNLFDQRGMCVSLGGAYSQAAGSNTQANSGVVVLGYQFNNQFRVGGYLDQQIHNKSSTMVSMSDSSPLMGAFAVWNQNANLQGAQIKWSSGYSRHDLSVTRPIVDEASEAGSGNTKIKSWGSSLIGSYMVPISDRWSTSPYAGIRYSRIKTNGYSETLNNDTVTTPLTFADLTQKSTAALLGAKLHTQINDRLNILASVGIERDLHYTGGRYLGAGDVETSSIDFNPNSNQTRMSASLGAYFDVAKKQRIGANIFWTEQPFTDKNSTSLFVNYTLGL